MTLNDDAISELLPVFDDRMDHAFQVYSESFRSLFHRVDQWVRFQAYVRGLLSHTPRKHIEGIASAVADRVAIDANVPQALQHFISDSPWDEQRLFALVGQQTRVIRRDPDAVWLVHDVIFPKKGRHSVGVQRQLARTVGRKINCQLGVMISQVGPRGFFPLLAQLYLPASWLREQSEARLRQLPIEQREAQPKINVAYSLLTRLQAAGEQPRPIVAEAGYHAAHDFADGLTQRGFVVHAPQAQHAERIAHSVTWLNAHLGLDHFEGRTWRGWHRHVSLVLAAYHYLALQGHVVGKAS